MNANQFSVAAPTRVDLAGGTLDLWPLFCLTEGAKTINLAIDLCAKAQFQASAAPNFKIEIQGPTAPAFSFQDPLSVEQAKLLDPEHRFPVAVLSRYLAQKHELPPLQVRVRWETQAPIGSGLGGSSTLCVALVRGISRIFGDFVDQGWQWQMLSWVRDVEAAFLRMPTGTQDYLAALFGGLNCFSSNLGRMDRLPYSDGVFEAIAERMVVIFSGEQHHSGISNWEVFKGAFEQNADIVSGLNRIRDITEQLDGELRSGTLSWPHIGELMREEWRVRKELFRVNTARLDEIIAFLESKGVLGAKVCGAAAGGSLLALIQPELKSALTAACTERGLKVLATSATRRGVRAE